MMTHCIQNVGLALMGPSYLVERYEETQYTLQVWVFRLTTSRLLNCSCRRDYFRKYSRDFTIY